MFAPHLPGFLRDVFINPFAQFRVERRLVQSWHLPLELHTEDLTLPWPLRFRRHWRCIAAHMYSFQAEGLFPSYQDVAGHVPGLECGVVGWFAKVGLPKSPTTDEYTHSLFQSKNEPGEAPGTAMEEAPFRFRFRTNLTAVAGAVGMWKARLCFLRFPRNRKIPGFVFGDFPVPSFPRPLRRQPQRREELAFRLLHALGGFGVAAASRDAL